MATSTTSDKHGHHDWHSAEYVDRWISSDATKDEDRKPWLRRTAALLPFEQEQKIRVLDVGAGYAMLSAEVLAAFPSSHVVLQDFSEPMFGHARQRLRADGDRTSFVACDFRDPNWTNAFDGPFDAVVSSIAIHNVRDVDVIQRVYADIRTLVAPGGCFYNVDFMSPAGPLSARAVLRGRRQFVSGTKDIPSVEAHLRWLRDAGFDEVDCLFRVDTQALVAGFVA